MRATGSFSVSVVIVNWNSRDELAECLNSLAQQSDRDFETIVVDNGSVDGSIEHVRSAFPSVVLLETGENLGFAEGCNRGIARATSEWIALLNNDAVADPRWIEELRAHARRGGPTLGMLQSRVVFKQKRDRTNSTGVLLFPDGTAVDRDFDAPLRQDDIVEEVFCTTAGAGLYRRAMLDEVTLPSGIFDRHYFMYLEDLDLGWRCRLAGWDALYVPSALVHHALYGSSKRHGNRFVERHCKRNRLRTLLKNGSASFVVRTIPRSLADIAQLVSWEGPRALVTVLGAIRESLRQRQAVSALARQRRRAVEARWITRER